VFLDVDVDNWTVKNVFARQIQCSRSFHLKDMPSL